MTALDLSRWYDRDGNAIEPNAAQLWVQDACWSEATTQLYITGGFGSAKTTTGANVLAQAMVENAEAGRHGRYAIVGHDLASVRHVMMAAFTGVLNGAIGHRGPIQTNPLVVDFNWMAKRLMLPFAEIVWSAGVDGCKSLEGTELTAAWADEGVLYLPEAHRRLKERLRQTGYPIRFLLHTFTPQPGRSLPLLHETCRTLTEEPNRWGAARFAMATRWNAANLPRGYIEELQASYSPAMAAAMLEGKFVILSGRVYPDYDGASHMDWPREGKPELPIVLSWDAGYHRPFIGVHQEYEPGSWVCHDEIALSDLSVDRQAREILGAPWMVGRDRVIVCPDPAARAVQSASGRSDVATIREVLKDHGVTAEFRFSPHAEDRLIERRCERLRAMICSYDGTRRLRVAAHLVGKRYRPGNDNQPVVGVDQSLSEQPLKDGSNEPDRGVRWDPWSHAADAEGYFATAMWTQPRADRSSWRQAMEPGVKLDDDPVRSKRRRDAWAQ